MPFNLLADIVHSESLDTGFIGFGADNLCTIALHGFFVKIPATLQPLIDTSRRPIPSLLKQLQVGQTLEARVLAQVQTGLLRLQLANVELLARSQVMLDPGTRLKLEVMKAQPMPELRILRGPTAGERQQLLVRSAMARQMPPAEVRNAAQGLRAEARNPAQMEGVQQLAGILRSSGIRLHELNAAQLKRAMEQSGLFHEARLAGVLPTDAADAKTRLLQLLALVRNQGSIPQKGQAGSPGTNGSTATGREAGADSLLNRLTRLIESAVSRIQLQQAAALPVEEGPRQAWQIDLPIQLPDESHEAMLRIEREAGKNGENTATWAVNLAFQFDSIGTLQTRIALSGERVSATFWSEHDHTHRRIEQRLPKLQEAFEAQGLEVVHLAGVLGVPAEPLIRVPMPDSLLDERA